MYVVAGVCAARTPANHATCGTVESKSNECVASGRDFARVCVCRAASSRVPRTSGDGRFPSALATVPPFPYWATQTCVPIGI
jgi:hypothetical protein